MGTNCQKEKNLGHSPSLILPPSQENHRRSIYLTSGLEGTHSLVARNRDKPSVPHPPTPYSSVSVRVLSSPISVKWRTHKRRSNTVPRHRASLLILSAGFCSDYERSPWDLSRSVGRWSSNCRGISRYIHPERGSKRERERSLSLASQIAFVFCRIWLCDPISLAICKHVFRSIKSARERGLIAI